MREAKFEFDFLPPASVRGNSRAGWRAKAAAVRSLRESGFARGLEWRATDATLAPPYRLTVRFRVGRSIDWDNLAIGVKPVIDGLEDAGVIADDREIREARVSVERGAPKSNQGFTLILSEIAV